MALDVNLYLISAEILDDLDRVLPSDRRLEFERVPAHADLDGHFACFVKRTEARPPEWAPWVAQGFNFVDGTTPLTQSAGCVVLFRAAGRLWAACFGTGWHAVAPVCEADFGLTVALNQVDPKLVRTLVTKTVDIKARQRDTHKVSGGEVQEFDLDFDLEWLRSAAGRTARVDCNVIAGADSLRLRGWSRPLRDLPQAAEEFLEIKGRGVPEVFAFTRTFQPVPKNDPMHALLEGDLEAAAQLRYQDDVLALLSVGIDAHLANSCTAYLEYGRHWSHELKGFDDAALREGLDALVEHLGDDRFELERVQLCLYAEEGGLVERLLLMDALQMQIPRDGNLYVRVERRWFRCLGDYAARLEERIRTIPDLSATLALPPWDKNIHPREEDYNKHVAGQRGWLKQDQEYVYQAGQKLETCDVLSPQRLFIHVKNGHDSAKLSHLFGQASATASLLKHDRAFYAEVKRRFQKKWPHLDFEQSGQPTMVLVIARHPGNVILGDMLISKLNLLEHVRRIRSYGFEVALCRVDFLEAATVAVAPPAALGDDLPAAAP